jgi:glycerophosphoryl diester phosphodiesterase
MAGVPSNLAKKPRCCFSLISCNGDGFACIDKKSVMGRIWLFYSCCLCLLSTGAYGQSPGSLKKQYFLIAHRGGVVDSIHTENSRPALEAAIKRGYHMVEVDLRLTKDSILIIQHAPTFKRYYGVDKPVSSMTWQEISKLRSSEGGSKVLKFEEVLKLCSGKIQLMVDNKIRGKDSVLFTKLVNLLKAYGLQRGALMIGTAESTPFFTGKIKLSCTRVQLERNMEKPGYAAENYYLFGTPEEMSASDIRWAVKHHIQVVAVINSFRYGHLKHPFEKAREDIATMKREGVTYFQIDSEFDGPFFH